MTEALLNPPVLRAETMIERWTHADFMRLAPEDQKAELIDGELIIMSPPFDEHERLEGFLSFIIMGFAARFDLGEVRGSRTPVFITETDTYEPDILFVRREREQIITRRKVIEAPDLIVEILSGGTSRYDKGQKLGRYSEIGVRELWLIDPYGPSGTQFFQRQRDRLIEVAPVNGIIHSVTLPNFHLNTAWLWPDESGSLPNAISVLRELGALG